jgi:hypothetical protein
VAAIEVLLGNRLNVPVSSSAMTSLQHGCFAALAELRGCLVSLADQGRVVHETLPTEPQLELGSACSAGMQDIDERHVDICLTALRDFRKRLRPETPIHDYPVRFVDAWRNMDNAYDTALEALRALWQALFDIHKHPQSTNVPEGKKETMTNYQTMCGALALRFKHLVIEFQGAVLKLTDCEPLRTQTDALAKQLHALRELYGRLCSSEGALVTDFPKYDFAYHGNLLVGGITLQALGLLKVILQGSRADSDPTTNPDKVEGHYPESVYLVLRDLWSAYDAALEALFVLQEALPLQADDEVDDTDAALDRVKVGDYEFRDSEKLVCARPGDLVQYWVSKRMYVGVLRGKFREQVFVRVTNCPQKQTVRLWRKDTAVRWLYRREHLRIDGAPQARHRHPWKLCSVCQAPVHHRTVLTCPKCTPKRLKDYQHGYWEKVRKPLLANLRKQGDGTVADGNVPMPLPAPFTPPAEDAKPDTPVTVVPTGGTVARLRQLSELSSRIVQLSDELADAIEQQSRLLPILAKYKQ